jgi:hypothetical protein
MGQASSYRFRVCSRAEIEAVRDTTSDQTLVDACNVALWSVDATGILSGCYTESTDRVRAAIVARIDSGEMVSGAGRTETVSTFGTSGEAWAFMREQDSAGRPVGFPSLKAPYTVRVLWGAL